MKKFILISSGVFVVTFMLLFSSPNTSVKSKPLNPKASGDSKSVQVVPQANLVEGMLAVQASVDPVVMAGNVECSALGYDYGYKIEPPASGTYSFDGHQIVLDVYNPYFDWTSTLGMDAVIVKGGPDSNVYEYDPEAYSDTGLHSPINSKTGSPYGLSHITFCYDYEVEVSKTAETSYTKTWNWDIVKTVTPENWELFNGEDGTSKYTVTVDKVDYSHSDWAVEGVITITNPNPFSDYSLTDVVDVVDGITASVDCGVSFPYTLVSGGTLTCTYGTDLPDGANRVNMVTVYYDLEPESATADVDFGSADVTEVYDEVTVTDSNNEGVVYGPFDDDASFTYEKTFDCSEFCGEGSYTVENVAEIVETGDWDDASVDVTCYEIDVYKTADTSYERFYEWTIDKWGDRTYEVLNLGDSLYVNYEVTVDADYTDSGWVVSGEVSVHNPASKDAELLSISDELDGVPVALDCGVTFPYMLQSGDLLTCTYAEDVLSDGDYLNEVWVEQQLYSYDWEDDPVVLTPVTHYAYADVSWGDPDPVTDECIDVNDTNVGFLGTVCAPNYPAVFTYSKLFGPFEECGLYGFPNTASFVTNDTETTGSDDWLVEVEVPCYAGCTLTIGYWKTHAYGDKYDDTWDMVGGPDALFLETGETYYWVISSETVKRAYLILGRQYIGAVLNQYAGASVPPEVQTVMDEAFVLLDEWDTKIGKVDKKGNEEVRAQFIALAEILDDYNNGYIGPGHCSD